MYCRVIPIADPRARAAVLRRYGVRHSGPEPRCCCPFPVASQAPGASPNLPPGRAGRHVPRLPTPAGPPILCRSGIKERWPRASPGIARGVTASAPGGSGRTLVRCGLLSGSSPARRIQGWAASRPVPWSSGSARGPWQGRQPRRRWRRWRPHSASAAVR